MFKATQPLVGNSIRENTTPHPFGILLKNKNDNGKVWMWGFLSRKVRGEYTGKQLNPKEIHVLLFQ